MRWARFEHGGVTTYGIVEDDTVEAVEGTPFGEYRRTGVRHPLAAIGWLPPVIPPTFYCVGLNYAEHILMAAKLYGREPVLAGQAGRRLPCTERAHRPSRSDRSTAGSDRAG